MKLKNPTETHLQVKRFSAAAALVAGLAISGCIRGANPQSPDQYASIVVSMPQALIAKSGKLPESGCKNGLMDIVDAKERIHEGDMVTIFKSDDNLSVLIGWRVASIDHDGVDFAPVYGFGTGIIDMYEIGLTTNQLLSFFPNLKPAPKSQNPYHLDFYKEGALGDDQFKSTMYLERRDDGSVTLVFTRKVQVPCIQE